MKKLLILFMIVAMLVSMVACGGNNETTTEAAVTTTEATTAVIAPGVNEGTFKAGVYTATSSYATEGMNMTWNFVLTLKADGTFTPDMIDFPTVHDGAEGVKFVHACLKSNQEGNVWVEL